MPFPNADECLNALLDAFAQSSAQGSGLADPTHTGVEAQPQRLSPRLASTAPTPAAHSWGNSAQIHTRTALDGVDFLTRMQVSATFFGHGFVACCHGLGLKPHALTLAQRRTLDEQMAAQFRQAADAGGLTPPETAQIWLRNLLVALTAAPEA